MKKIIILTLLLSLLPLSAQAENNFIKLNVPYTSEIPTGSWVAPWNNACEEASIVMINSYYFGNSSMTKSTAIESMKPLFTIENKIFGSNADTDATRTARLINEYTDFTATIKTNPTLEEIKKEIDNGNPVITFHYAKDLPNKNHRWRVGGSYYHVMALIGYDDEKKEFIFNDSGDPITGGGYRYTYDAIMKSLHDFDHKLRKANGPARVIFTKSKVLFRNKENGQVFLISHDTKQYISSPAVFKKMGWKWIRVREVDSKKLSQFKSGPAILP